MGVNLLPLNKKACTFNCLYCECGWTGETGGTKGLRDEETEGLRDEGTFGTAGPGLSGAEGEREGGRERGTEGRREGLKSQRSVLSAARGAECDEVGDKTMGEVSGFPGREEVRAELERKLVAMAARNDMITNITFAGNGEPTLHPDFPGIIDDAVALRDKYFPSAGIAVLSNASLVNRQEIVNALLKVDQNILKLDAGTEETFQRINNPRIKITLRQIIENLTRFEGKLIIQSLFVKGTYHNVAFDNTTNGEVTAWLGNLDKIRPQCVMIYPIARETPIEDAEKISMETLQEIAQRVEALGIQTEVYY